MKRFLTLAIMALALSAARASVVINETNFPDEAMRYALIDSQIDADGDGILTDEEIENANGIYIQGCKNLKGLELFKNIETILLAGNEESYSSITSIDLSKFPKLFRFEIEDYALTSLDATYSPNLWNVCVVRCREFTSIKVDSERDDLAVFLNHLPKLTSMENCVFNHVSYVEFYKTGIQDIDMSNHPTLTSLCAKGDDEGDYELNSINVSGCNNLWDIGMFNVKLQSVRLNSLPMFYALQIFQSQTTDLSVENMANLGSIKCDGCTIQNLTIKGCPELTGVDCSDNSLHNLIIDDSPHLYSLSAANNMLMWLDMSNVQREAGEDSNWFIVDNQQPQVQAVKISPTETGLRVHSRLDVNRVLNLRAKGITQTPRETTVDGIRYFVFYDNGPDTPNLVGSDCYYEYETKWPYPCIGENTKDNNLPVTLNVYSWTKHQAFLTLSESRVSGVYGKPAPAAPIVTRSQDYDGKITFSSSNENVVKVNAETGELTVIGAGTAIISVKGEETDYRLAPVTKTYTVFIDKATPAFSFAQANVTTTLGEAVPENKLSVGLYDGEVQYSSSDEAIATVDANGMVTTLAIGQVIITATGAETQNCYEAVKAQYTLTVNESAGISGVTAGTAATGKVYDLQGRKVNAQTAKKGVYVVGGKKVVVQ